MAEAGGPALSEIQPQPAGVVDRVKGKLREVLTPTGRAEVMAQKQIDAILVQVPEDKRAEAMEILESKRPEFVVGKMEDAKGSLVRDAVVGVAVVGGVGVGLWKRKEIGELVGKGAGKVFEKMPQKAQGAVLQVGGKIGEANAAVGKFTGGLKGRVDGAMSWMKGRLRPMAKIVVGGTPPELVDAFLSQAIKLPELDVVDNAQKITAEFLGKALTPGIFNSSELQNTQGEQLARVFLKKAGDAGRWVPLVTAKGREPWGFGDDHEGIGGLMTRGLVTMKELSNGLRLFIPTEKFVEFVKKHITSS